MFFISVLISSLIQSSFRNVLFNLQISRSLCIYKRFFSSTLSFLAFLLSRIQGVISIFWKFQRFILCPTVRSILEKLLCATEYHVYSFVSDGIFCRCLLSPFDVWCHIFLIIVIFSQVTCLFKKREVLESSIQLWLLLICHWSQSYTFYEIVVPEFGAHMFGIVCPFD